MFHVRVCVGRTCLENAEDGTMQNCNKKRTVCACGGKEGVCMVPPGIPPQCVFKEMEYGIWKDKFSISICK